MSSQDKKRYYWLKLKRDFFKRHDIQIVEAMPNGKDYILFYLKLLVESVDHEGCLRFSDTVPYNAEMLSVVTNTPVETVNSALGVFSKLKMIEVLRDETIFMNAVQSMIGSETMAAVRQRELRASKGDNVTQTGDNVASVSPGCRPDVARLSPVCRPEIEKEIEIDIEKEPEKEKDNIYTLPTTPIGDGKNIPTSLEEIKAFALREDIPHPELFYRYCVDTKWTVRGKPMVNWQGCYRAWAKYRYTKQSVVETETDKVDTSQLDILCKQLGLQPLRGQADA